MESFSRHLKEDHIVSYTGLPTFVLIDFKREAFRCLSNQDISIWTQYVGMAAFGVMEVFGGLAMLPEAAIRAALYAVEHFARPLDETHAKARWLSMGVPFKTIYDGIFEVSAHMLPELSS